ncbi:MULTISPECIES: hypothetical protein [Gottfriedia]|uniref:Uncharacterized protein n=1 Tax=Gottfriedia solisilvae TaxID=1516104 RepID=A0A8J3EYA1_9BACI|nr:hypothetical protein [Gottfriedia solisilvae]GGI14002.1 hypothetical protein GCM10007380_20760 [Gottfriedia solisilvae]
MSENINEPKKVSLQELMKQKLASKKQQQSSGNTGLNAVKDMTKKNQITKKPNNQRKRMGV